MLGRMTRRSTWRGVAPRDDGGLFDLGIEFGEDGLDAADAERKRHEEERRSDAEPGAGEVHVKRAVGAVEREQREARHDRRECEG